MCMFSNYCHHLVLTGRVLLSFEKEKGNFQKTVSNRERYLSDAEFKNKTGKQRN